MKVTILTEAELRRCAPMDAGLVDAIAEAFSWIEEGRVEMPPIMHIDVPEHNGTMDIKSAYVRGLESFAIKVGSGFLDNRKLGLPSSSAMMVVASAKTGFTEAVLLDNGYLTDARTGAAGAVAARHLARETIETVGVLGAGAQARYQIEALKLVRAFKRLLVCSRSGARLDRYVDEMGPRLGVEVLKARNAEELVRESDVVVTTTPAETPLVEADWVHPGLHITAMGSDAPGKRELAPAVLGRADLVVCDTRAQCLACGELRHARHAGVLADDADVIDLGALTAGKATGRSRDDQITVCDLTGTGAQDTAIAVRALERARALGLGAEIEA